MAENVISIDFNKKLEITINNTKPVVLTDLTLSLLAINHQYQKFVETEATADYQAATELYIKEIRPGSIIVELVAQAMPLVPLLWAGGSLSEWVNQAKATIEWLLGKIDKPPREITKTDLSQWNQILEPVAKDNASQLNLTVRDSEVTINQYIINSEQANAAQNRIRKEIDDLETPIDHVRTRQVMYWYQSRFDRESNSGDKAIIEAVSKKALKVIFENNAAKDTMLNGDPRFNKPWHKLAYVVDVEVQTIMDQPKAYKVLKAYADDTFDPGM